MSLPSNMDDYLHRAGRTGRNGREGKEMNIFKDITNNAFMCDIGQVITITNPEQDFVIQRYCNELGVEMIKRVVKIKK